MSIAEYLINRVNHGHLRMDRPGYVAGMGVLWKFIPDRKYGPGILVNELSETVMGAAELADRQIPDYITEKDLFDWQVIT